ncbi:E1 ubiquitin-activating protein uba2 [Quaeritorhiza haematococci]|nr:E1 ubiquitin-activating protein uba2 [Quaeritorhiza haematococci]
MTPPRDSHVQTALGTNLYKTIKDAKVLLVGAGGIGCELLKNLVYSGFHSIEVVDLDTIDLSNLNRQFLFQKQHIKKSKAKVARESALKMNPTANITAHHASIFDPQFDLDWFGSFHIVLNALDNLPARRHVNMMCLAVNVPLVESGTAGYLGQVTVHQKVLHRFRSVRNGSRKTGRGGEEGEDEFQCLGQRQMLDGPTTPGSTQCFDCEPKPTPKTFPVCTIRSTPSTPIHCIVWAKNYLFSKLFGKDEDEDDTVTQEGDEKENMKQIENLKKEAEALKRIRESAGSPEFVEKVFSKVYDEDIKRLRGMEDLWKTRKPPTPLGYKDVAGFRKSAKTPEGLQRDQTVWGLESNFAVFAASAEKLAQRSLEERKSDPEAFLSFDKDDDDALDFVTAAANLRAYVFGIEKQSRFKTKEMAGNIIPAIATTNAIVAGLIVLQAFKILNNKFLDCKNTYLTPYGSGNNKLLHPSNLPTPNDQCDVCRNTYIRLVVDTKRVTLGQLVEEVVKGKKNGLGIPGEITVDEGGRLLCDFDFDDNLEMTLAALNITDGKRLLITNDFEDDEEEGEGAENGTTNRNYSVIMFIKHRDSTEQSKPPLWELVGDRALVPRPKKKPAEAPAEEDKRKGKGKEVAVAGTKRKADEVEGDGLIVLDDDDAVLIE